MRAKREHQVQNCGVALTPPFFDFGKLEVGYEPVAPVYFVIRNTSGLPLANLSVSIEERDIENYWLCLAHTADALGCAGGHDSETCFYVYPQDRLACGTHSADIRVQADGMAPLHVPLSFTVCPQKSLPVSPDLFAGTATP